MDHKSKIDDSDILDYLMTSDFNDGYTIDESRLLLLKFRQFYRILQSTNEGLKHVIGSNKTDIENIKLETSKKIEKLENKVLDLEKFLDNINNKKLTFMERLTGKIKIEIKYDTERI